MFEAEEGPSTGARLNAMTGRRSAAGSKSVTPRSRNSSWIVFLVASALLLAACGSKGPDLKALVKDAGVANSSELPTLTGLDAVTSDAIWTADGSVAAVADSLVAEEKPDERTDDAGGDVFLLYKSGTLWVTEAPNSSGSAVVLYEDNDKAYNRHSVILLRNRSWGNRVNNYRSSSSSSGNGFRGGGSSSGK